MRRVRGLDKQRRQALRRLLGELEQDIMLVLWDRRDASVRDVLELLNSRREPERQLAYTTVMTVMSRLTEKGVLERRLVGKAHTYSAMQTPEAFVAKASDELVRQLVADFGDAAIASFVSILQRVPPERLARLRAQANQRARSRD